MGIEKKAWKKMRDDVENFAELNCRTKFLNEIAERRRSKKLLELVVPRLGNV